MKTTTVGIFLLFISVISFAQAELIISSYSLSSETFQKGDVLQVNMEVKNVGNQSSNAGSLGIYLSKFRSINNILPKPYFLKRLEVGESIPIVLIFPITNNLLPDEYFLFLGIDIFNQTNEIDEGNLYLVQEKITILNSYNSKVRLPYPVILVHGWEGSSLTWDETRSYYSSTLGYSFGGYLNYCLNYSNSTHLSDDIRDFTQNIIPADFYIINFDIGVNGEFNVSDDDIRFNNVQSNQASIVKQGRALKFAINRVLNATNRDKVILIGHSMGGLASREYIQNSYHWQPDGEHHVAKVLTIGTPNGGSNVSVPLLTALKSFFSDDDMDEYSEAVRDLRYFDGEGGVYLDGGFENSLSIFYKNRDVNCDGDENDIITGLNDKFAPDNIEYASIVGTGTDSDWNPFIMEDGDGVVRSDRGNIKDFIGFETSINLPFIESFYTYKDVFTQYHTDLINGEFLRYSLIGKDETDRFQSAIEIDFNRLYQGLITEQDLILTDRRDFDNYTFEILEDGEVQFFVVNIPVQDFALELSDDNYNRLDFAHSVGNTSMLLKFALRAGKYHLRTIGMPNEDSWNDPYYLFLNFKPTDEANVCTPPNSCTKSITGKILSMKSEPVESVVVEVENENQINNTSRDGSYSFALPVNKNYTITPNRNDDFTNGISTFDLVLINQHILGLKKFESAYQYIAADVNKSNSITSFDMVLMRQVILGIITEFPNNTSWRFIDASYQFGANPLSENFNESIAINNLSSDINNLDFIAVKVGDVNASANTNSFTTNDSRSKKSSLKLQTIDKRIMKGEQVRVVFISNDIEEVLGYQFTMNYENLDLGRILEGAATNENFNVQMNENLISSWNGNAKNGDILFGLDFIANQEGKLSDLLTINSDIIKSEAYSLDGEVLDVEIEFIPIETNEQFSSSNLFEVYPNPASYDIKVRIELQEKKDFSLHLVNSLGQEVWSGAFKEKSLNQTINIDHLSSGSYFIRLISKGEIKNKIVILK